VRLGLGAATAALLAIAIPAGAQDGWTGRLQGGGVVEINPETNRPTVRVEGEETQLWDGVHRLQSGQELRVEDGRVVPNQAIIESRQPAATPPEALAPTAEVGPTPCEQLVERVCGADGACAESRACPPARQLLGMEREEQGAAGLSAGSLTFTSGKCREALADDFFTPCTPEPQRSAEPTRAR
jgi:hypothetical protein